MKKNPPEVPAHWVQSSAADEIDLHELFIVLWRQRLLIVLVTAVFAIAGIAYAFLAPQVWTSTAVITTPDEHDLLALQRVASQAKLLGLTEFPAEKELYDTFVSEFNAYENRRDYLRTTGSFKETVATNKLDIKGQRRWLRQWAALIKADVADNKGESAGIALALASDTAFGSINLLKGYIDYIVELQKKQLVNSLNEGRTIKLESFVLQQKLIKEDAERGLKREIDNTESAISVARAAGASQPLQNYYNGDRFPINLGAKGLEEKLRLLKNIDLNTYEPKLMDLQIQIDRLKSVKLEGIDFRPFSYLDAPEEPVSRDKPKRPLVVVLATLLGGMLGVGIVLVRFAFRKRQTA